ncbi:hypothetical protein AABB02_02820 [Streptomyces rimosus]
MRTQAHRIVNTDPQRGNVVVRVTGSHHDEPTYQIRQSPPSAQEVPVMIQPHQLTKRYGDKTAVHTVRFTIAPGTVTGFLGPNVARASPRPCG